MSLLFDLDGVLRMLGTAAFGFEVDKWDAKVNGKSAIEAINDNLSLCINASESEYLPIVNAKLDEITILTNQLPNWIPYTKVWLKEHLTIPYKVIYTNGPDQKLRLLEKDSILVEDFPKFSSYQQIALITRNYNKHLEVPYRISNVEQFKDLIDNWK
jgi:hypothetical protein